MEGGRNDPGDPVDAVGTVALVRLHGSPGLVPGWGEADRHADCPGD